MSTCVIGHISIRDPDKWAEYRKLVPATLLPFHGKVLLRGRRLGVLCGEHPHTDTVVLEFPDAAAAQGWYRSRAYQTLIPLREQAAEVTLIHFETL